MKMRLITEGWPMGETLGGWQIQIPTGAYFLFLITIGEKTQELMSIE